MTIDAPRTAPDFAPTEAINQDCHAALADRAALQQAMRAQGETWHNLVTERCPHLFADVAVFISAAQLRQMREVIAAVERVVALDGWMSDSPLPQKKPHLNPLPLAGEEANEKGNLQSLGVFFGYDFHLNVDGAHLIEINTNAGGGFLNALLLDSQRDAGLPGEAVAVENPEQVFVEMFRNEYRLAHGDAPLNAIAIVDEQPEAQYLYPEFLLAKKLFERNGIAAHIVDPAALQSRADGLYLGEQRIDLVYNRLTDFSLRQHPALHQAYLQGAAVITPHPQVYARYADKRNLARLTDAQAVRALGANEADIAILQAGIPRTLAVQPEMENQLWAARKQLFFKPNSGYGSKGAYRGEKLTKRVFGEILHGDYVAQQLAAPGERSVCVNDAEPLPLKFDVRCYTYDGQTQLVAARLYQGQTTNFRTPGGGFSVVRVLG